MMEKNDSFFENRNNDWLAQEIRREKRVSAWDFDEGKKVKEEHEENCDKDEVAQEHIDVHDEINTIIRRAQPALRQAMKPAVKAQASGLVVFVVIMFITAFVMINVIALTGSSSRIFSILEFIIPMFPMLIFAFVFIVIFSAARKR